jgi:D-alanyl-D-alanine dipeptidase
MKLKIYDCYRPKSVQMKMFYKIHNSKAKELKMNGNIITVRLN